MDDLQAGIKIAGENINNLTCEDDTILIAESKKEYRASLMKVKGEREKAGFNINVQNTKSLAPGPISSCQIDGEKVETETDFLFLGFKITADGDCSHKINTCCLEEKL